MIGAAYRRVPNTRAATFLVAGAGCGPSYFDVAALYNGTGGSGWSEKSCRWRISV